MKIAFIIAAAVGVFFAGCKKTTNDFRPLTSYTVVNATTDILSAKIYAAGHEIPWKTLPNTDAVSQYGKAGNFYAGAGPNIIRSVSAADTTAAIFNSSKAEDFRQGKMNNIFLCGNATSGYSSVFLNNEDPVNYTDSVAGIRFINLSPNSTPLNITLSTSPGINEATGLAYKQITNFKTYISLQNSAAMVFQIRDAANTLLASYTFPVGPASAYNTVGMAHSRFKGVTLVVKGLQGTTAGTNALGIFPVPHY